MVPERIALFPQYAAHIRAYATRFNETVPGPVEGSHMFGRSAACGGCAIVLPDQFRVTSSGRCFRPTQPIFDHFEGHHRVGRGESRQAPPRASTRSSRRARGVGRVTRYSFTDDNPANIAAAQARGWNAHLFTDAASLEAALVGAELL